MNDPAFQADADKRQLDLSFTSGEEIQSIIDKKFTRPRPRWWNASKQIVQTSN